MNLRYGSVRAMGLDYGRVSLKAVFRLRDPWMSGGLFRGFFRGTLHSLGKV